MESTAILILVTYIMYVFIDKEPVLFSPAQELWIGEDLLQSAVIADAKGEDGLSWVAGKMPGDASREGQHHLASDLHHTSGTEGEERSC